MKIALSLFLISALAAAPAKTFFTQEQALKHAFGTATTTSKHTHYWSVKQRERLAQLAAVDKVVDVRSYHAVHTAKAVKGQPTNTNTVWFDKRIVRTKAQEIMLVIDAKGVVQDLVVCAFDEPIKYKPSAKWYGQFHGLDLDDELHLKKGIHGVSGATYTARSTTAAVRELLSAAQIARELAAAKKKGKAPTQ